MNFITVIRTMWYNSLLPHVSIPAWYGLEGKISILVGTYNVKDISCPPIKKKIITDPQVTATGTFNFLSAYPICMKDQIQKC